MKTTNILALSLSTCLLVACGGSDSLKLNSHHDKVPEKYTVSGSDSLYTNKDVFSGAKPNQATGFAFANAGGDKRMLVHGFDEFNYDTIKVGAHTIKLPDVKADNKSQHAIGIGKGKSGSPRILVTTRNFARYVRLGYYNTGEKSAGGYGVFANGKLTAVNNVPTTGKAKYRGNEVYGVYKPAGKSNVEISGHVNLDVDFGAKTVAGNIGKFIRGATPDSSIKAIDVNAKIYGNKFMQDKGAMVNGGFYGPKAEHLAGVATQGSVFVAFGAEKQ